MSKLDQLHDDLKKKYITEEYQRISRGLRHGGTINYDGTIEECYCSDCMYTLQHEPTLA